MAGLNLRPAVPVARSLGSLTVWRRVTGWLPRAAQADNASGDLAQLAREQASQNLANLIYVWLALSLSLRCKKSGVRCSACSA